MTQYYINFDGNKVAINPSDLQSAVKAYNELLYKNRHYEAIVFNVETGEIRHQTMLTDETLAPWGIERHEHQIIVDAEGPLTDGKLAGCINYSLYMEGIDAQLTSRETV